MRKSRRSSAGAREGTGSRDRRLWNGGVRERAFLLIKKQAAAQGCTALIVASQNGHIEVVRLLLARQDVDVNRAG